MASGATLGATSMLAIAKKRIQRTAKSIVKNLARRADLEIASVSRLRAEFDRSIAGSFTSSSGQNYPLFSGYRNYLKRNWRTVWWPLEVLYGISHYHNITLSSSVKSALAELSTKSTLLKPVQEYLQMLKDFHASAAKVLYPDIPKSEISLDKKLYLRPTQKHIAESFANYSGIVDDMLAQLKPTGFDITGKKCLEIGCGTGMFSLFLSSRGAHSVTGLDMDLSASADITRNQLAAVLRRRRGQAAVDLVQGNVLSWRGDGTGFDLIFSVSVMEHISDMNKIFQATRELLKPGGLVYHTYDPWFGPSGGHAMHTYDFPWAHVRLSRSELERYLRQLRPYEAEDALRSYDHQFSTPRFTLSEFEDLAVASGFEVIRWKELRHQPHGEFLSPQVLQEAKANYPKATVRDLLCYNATVILRKK